MSTGEGHCWEIVQFLQSQSSSTEFFTPARLTFIFGGGLGGVRANVEELGCTEIELMPLPPPGAAYIPREGEGTPSTKTRI